MAVIGESLGMLGKGIKMAVNKAEDFLPWAEEVTYIDEATNGVIKLAKYPDGRTTVIELEVPKEFRGKGVGKKLQAQAMSDNSNLSGQVSSKKAATSAYNLGRRPIDNPNATLEDVYAAIDDMSSVNMATPDAIKAFNGGDSPSGLFNEILELYKTEPLAARKMAKRGGILDEIDDQIPRPKGDVSNVDELRAKANAERFNEDYSGQHSAPMSGDGAPLNDLSQVYPDDIYSSKGLQYYGTGDNAIDSESIGIINLLKGKPDQTVTMYRAVPSNAGDVDINAGDWVSLSESYVKQHGEAALNGDYKIISKEVPANQLFTNGDSINEFGFDPANKAPSGLLDMAASDDSEAGVVGKLTNSLFGMLDAGKNSGEVVNYPDEWISQVPYELRKEVARHNEGILGSSYREGMEASPTYYRGGGTGRSELKPDTWMSTDPHQASTYAGKYGGGNVMPLKVSKDNVPEVYSNSPEWNRIGLYDSDIKIPANEYPEGLGYTVFGKEPDAWETTDTNILADWAKKNGFGGIGIKGLKDVGPYQRGADLTSLVRAESLSLGDPSKARSVNAVFDPAKASSSNLIASKPAATIGAGILGAIGASQSGKTYADYSPSNLARLQNDDVGGYQAPFSGLLARAAMGANSLNDRGVDDPLMQFVAPRLPSELMGKIAYNDKRGASDYLKAAAGLLGLY